HSSAWSPLAGDVEHRDGQRAEDESRNETHSVPERSARWEPSRDILELHTFTAAVCSATGEPSLPRSIGGAVLQMEFCLWCGRFSSPLRTTSSRSTGLSLSPRFGEPLAGPSDGPKGAACRNQKHGTNTWPRKRRTRES